MMYMNDDRQKSSGHPTGEIIQGLPVSTIRISGL